MNSVLNTADPGAEQSDGADRARLSELLTAELARIRDLEAALDAEHAALVGNDPDTLESATRAKGAAIAAQQAQQAQREAWLRERGMDTSPLGESIRRLGGASECEQLHATMIDHARRCQERNRRNGALIQRLQDRTRGALNVLRQSDGQPALYSTSGHREPDDDTRSLGKA